MTTQQQLISSDLRCPTKNVEINANFTLSGAIMQHH